MLHYVQSTAVVVEMSKRMILRMRSVGPMRLPAYLAKVTPIHFIVPETRRKNDCVKTYKRINMRILQSSDYIQQRTFPKKTEVTGK
jgi:hypothetical protein